MKLRDFALSALVCLACLIVTAAPISARAQVPPETQCSDGADNDGDGWVDLKDSDCQTYSTPTKPPSGGGAGTPAPTNCPPPTRLTVGTFRVDFRGNECTEYLLGAPPSTIAKQMPNLEINGAMNAFLGTADLVNRGLNYEHVIHGCNSPNNYFTPRLNHFPMQLIGTDQVRMTEFDVAWKLWTNIEYRVSQPTPGVGRIDRVTTYVPEDAAIFCSPYFVAFHANYMPFTTDAKLYFLGKTAASAPETWMALAIAAPGISVMHEADTALPVDSAPANSYGYAIDYKGQLKTLDWPRYTQPFYCTVTTSTNTVLQMMFDSTATRFTGMRFQVQTGGEGTPAQDWQDVIRNPVAHQQYIFRARAELRPYNPATFESECRDAYAAWMAGQ